MCVVSCTTFQGQTIILPSVVLGVVLAVAPDDMKQRDVV